MVAAVKSQYGSNVGKRRKKSENKMLSCSSGIVSNALEAQGCTILSQAYDYPCLFYRFVLDCWS